MRTERISPTERKFGILVSNFTHIGFAHKDLSRNHLGSPEKIDLVVTLGGDGTILHASSLFSSGAVPPVLSFSMGTLGFLLPFRPLLYLESARTFAHRTLQTSMILTRRWKVSSLGKLPS